MDEDHHYPTSINVFLSAMWNAATFENKQRFHVLNRAISVTLQCAVLFLCVKGNSPNKCIAMLLIYLPVS